MKYHEGPDPAAKTNKIVHAHTRWISIRTVTGERWNILTECQERLSVGGEHFVQPFEALELAAALTLWAQSGRLPDPKGQA